MNFLFRNRITISVLLCAVALVVAAVGFAALAAMRPPVAAREPIERVFNVDVFRAEVHSLKEVISGFGTAEPDQEVLLSAKVSGSIESVHPELEVGTAVFAADISMDDSGHSKRRSGDVLVRIDPRPFEERVQRAENQIRETQSEIATLEQQLKNNRKLLDKARTDYKAIEAEHERTTQARQRNAASDSQVTRSLLELQRYRDAVLQYETQADILPLQIESLRRRIETGKREVALARIELDQATVNPPFSGRISEVMVERGQYVQPGQTLMRITDSETVLVPIPLPLHEVMKLQSRVDASDYPRVELAENESDAPRWTGRLVRVAPVADERTRTVKVYVEVDNREFATPLMPGAFVHARIEGPHHESVVAIPRDAIVGGRIFVVDATGTVESRIVSIRHNIQSLALVEEGIAVGEHIVLTNLDMLRSGTQTEIQSERTLQDEFDQGRVRFVQVDDTGLESN